MRTAHELVELARPQIHEVQLSEAQAAINAADVLIDVREPDEYANGHIPGAINIPRGVLEFKLTATPELAARDLQLNIYCKTSGPAALAALSLKEMGYLKVSSLAGGFDAWSATEMPIAKPASIDFD